MNENGIIRGFKNKKAYKLNETHAPVLRLPLVRAVLSIGNKYNLDLHQLDV